MAKAVINIDLTKVFRIIVIAIGFLFAVGLLLSIAGIYWQLNQQSTAYFVVQKLFALDTEKNFPTFFSFLLLMTCATASFLTAFSVTETSRKDFLYWMVLAALFLLIGFDEAARMHEQVGMVLREHFNATGFAYYTWVIPAMVLVAILAIVYLPFLMRLPRRMALLMILSAVLYIGGAAGIEVFGGRQEYLYGKYNITYTILSGFEEVLEMSGLALYAWAVLSALTDRQVEIQLNLSRSKS